MTFNLFKDDYRRNLKWIKKYDKIIYRYLNQM